MADNIQSFIKKCADVFEAIMKISFAPKLLKCHTLFVCAKLAELEKNS